VRIVRDSPKLPDLALTTQTYVELLAAFFAADLTTERREAAMAGARSLSADDKSIAACRVRGFTMSHCDWILASRRRAALRGRWLALFEDVDVVLCPAMPTPAFPHDHTPMAKRALDIDGQNRSYFDQLAWAGPATLNGLPATTAPIGRTDTGLPIGVQIIGGFLDDRTTIAFAGMVEREFGGFTLPPML
jgi:amidase